MKKNIFLSLLFLIFIGTYNPLQAQQKPAIQPDDYGKWESLGYGTPISPNGEWLAVPINRVNDKGELQIINIGDGSKVVIPYGGNPAFSADSKWLVYSIGVSPETREKLEKQDKNVKRKAGIFNLTTHDTTQFAAISSFEFSADGHYLALYGYRGDDESAGLLVVEPTTGTTVNFGNVTEYSWSDKGSHLAFIVQVETGESNGVQLYNPQTGSIRVLESSSDQYSGLTWRKDTADLAVLRAVQDSTYKDETHVVLAWRDVGAQSTSAIELQPSNFELLSGNLSISEHYDPVWSKDGTQIYIGLRPRQKADFKPEYEVDMPEDTEWSDVQIWDVDAYHIYPYQHDQVNRYKNRTIRAVWHIDENEIVQLGSNLSDVDLNDGVDILNGGRYATQTNHLAYKRPNMFGRHWYDVYLINTETGERQKIITKTQHFMGGSASGRYLLWFDGKDYWTYDIKSGAKTNITQGIDAPFTNVDDDYPGPVEPPAGIAGWSKNDDAVLVYSTYDIWGIAPDGSNSKQVTNGEPDEIVYRVVRLDQEGGRFRFFRSNTGDEGINLDEPVYLSMTGKKSKKEGYARLENGSVSKLTYETLSQGRLQKADDAAVLTFVRQDYNDSPDIFTTGPGFEDINQITQTNSFQDEYAWGHSQLINYESAVGVPLQGALFYPVNYDDSQKYPMIVYQYEKLSQRVHDYMTPSLTNYYNATVWSSMGYFVLMPDIVYRGGQPGQSAVDAIVPAVKKVIEMGLADANKIGLIGHSFGGYQATFVPTQTDIFAAVVEGAGITNMLSFDGQIHWNSGTPELNHWETGQFRMAKPPWEAFDNYLQNSPIHFITQLSTPMLMEAGDKDGTVDWHQALQFYNLARRAGVDDLILLVYPGANHGLRTESHQIDYHKRILQWFGHWLKGEPAKDWMTNGVSYIKRQQRIKAAKEQ